MWRPLSFERAPILARGVGVPHKFHVMKIPTFHRMPLTSTIGSARIKLWLQKKICNSSSYLNTCVCMMQWPFSTDTRTGVTTAKYQQITNIIGLHSESASQHQPCLIYNSDFIWNINFNIILINNLISFLFDNKENWEAHILSDILKQTLGLNFDAVP